MNAANAATDATAGPGSRPVDVLPRVARGEHDAVQGCIDRYGNLVWSLALRQSPSRADAEDAVQEVFVELWRHADRFDASKASEATFVAMIARRRLIDRQRKRSRGLDTQPIEAASESGSDANTPADTAAIAEEADRARAAITDLGPPADECVRLAVDLGLTQTEIADRLGLPLGTVKTHIRRGLIKVRRALQPTDN